MLKKLTIDNFTVFEHAEFDFGMLNVIHGENGTGKTHLLKVIHLLAGAGAQPDVAPSHANLLQYVPDLDKPAVKLMLALWDRAARLFGVPNLHPLVRNGRQEGMIVGAAHLGGRLGIYVGHDPEFDLPRGVELTADWLGAATFIPATDVLLRDPALVDLYAEREIREDCTAPDLLAQIRKPPLRHLPEWASAVLADLEAAIGGKPQVDANGAVAIRLSGQPSGIGARGSSTGSGNWPGLGDGSGAGAGSGNGRGDGSGSGAGQGDGDGSGYGDGSGSGAGLSAGGDYHRHFSGARGTHLAAALVAQGHLRLATLALVMTRVDLRKGWTLCWDEPEANLNPALLKVVAKAIVMLAQAGVQVFIATHSLFLLREIEVQSADLSGAKPSCRYFGLHRSGSAVVVEQGENPDDAGDVAALEANLDQSKRMLDLEGRR